LAHIFDFPTGVVISGDANTSIPFSTSAYLMQDVLQNPAVPEATDPTRAFKKRSLLPVAVLVSPEVSFLSEIPTKSAEETARVNPFARSLFVKTEEAFLF